MKFWLCFVGLLPFFLVVGVAALVMLLFDGMRRDLARWRTMMAEEMAADQTKREGFTKMMLITGLTPPPQPRYCAACGMRDGTPHLRGCVMTLTLQEPHMPAAAAPDLLEAQVARQEEHRRRLFETDLLLYCLEQNTCLRDEERRKLYEVWRNGSVELRVIRRTAAGRAAKIDVEMQAVAVQAAAWRGWRRAGWQRQP